MTLPLQGKKLTQNEVESITIALEHSDIRAIHPDRMKHLLNILFKK